MQERELRLRRGIGLADATLIGLGAMVGAGIFVLTGIAAGAAGPGLLLAFALNGLIALTVAAGYAELGSTYPHAGGSYAWAKLALPPPFGFLAGWGSWLSNAVAASLYSLGFGAYFAQLLGAFGLGLPGLSEGVEVKLYAAAVILAFALVNYRGSAATGQTGRIFTLGQMAVLFVFVASGLWALRGLPEWPQRFTPMLPQGFGGMLTAMGLTFIAFEGYEIIAQCGEEVQEPRRTIPRAILLSVILVVPIYVLIAFTMLAAVRTPEGVASWQLLGEHAELAVLEAARQFAPGGILLLLLGGIFATTSALNATLYASSRVSFAMGRDFNLPPLFAAIHARRRTPHAAIFVSAAVVLAMALALPLEDVASAASIVFMLLFASMNLAVVALRYQQPDAPRPFRVPLFPWLPIASTLLLFVLAAHLFTFSATAWFLTAGWIALGLVVYREYARTRERDEVGARPLLEERTLAPVKGPVLVGLANPKTVSPLMRIACALARRRDRAVIALNMVRIPRQLPRSEGRRFIDRAEPLLEAAVSVGREMDTPVYGALWVSSDIAQGMIEAIAEKRPSLVVLGWRGHTRASDRLFGATLDPVLLRCRADTALLRWRGGDHPIEKVLVGVTASPHAMLAIEVARDLAEELDLELRFLHVIKQGTRMDQATEEMFLAHRQEIEHEVDLEITQAPTTAQGIIQASGEADLLVLGAAREGLVSQFIFGEKSRAIARRARCSVLLVKRRPGPAQSLLRRLFTRQS